MMNPWLPEKHKILDIIKETDMESTFVVEYDHPSIQHGQFFQLSLPKITVSALPSVVLEN